MYIFYMYNHVLYGVYMYTSRVFGTAKIGSFFQAAATIIYMYT